MDKQCFALSRGYVELKNSKGVRVTNHVVTRSKNSNFMEDEELNNPKPEDLYEMKSDKIVKKDCQEFEMMSFNLMVENEEKQILLSPPVSKGH